MPNSSLIQGLTLAANILANSARSITSVGGPGGYPKVIPEAIRVGQAEVSDTQGRIVITTENIGDKRNADITKAFELGSGLTGPSRKRYPITPGEGKSVLRFPWEVSLNIGIDEGVSQIVNDAGIAYLPSVMHPGIRPNPFLQRALDAVIGQIDEILTESFEINLLESLEET